jgi:putative oxidoreductase
MQLSRSLPLLVATSDSLGPTVLRWTLGLVMLPHGLQKTFGWFGGYGFEGTMGWLTGTVGAPWILALLAILAESVGAVMLLLGLGTRLAALGIGAVMVVAISVHWTNGFFMNWSGTQPGEGFEYHLLALGLAGAILLLGGGRFSVDGRLAR